MRYSVAAKDGVVGDFTRREKAGAHGGGRKQVPRRNVTT